MQFEQLSPYQTLEAIWQTWLYRYPLAPMWTAFSDYTGTDLFCATVFIFSCFVFLSFYCRAVD